MALSPMQYGTVVAILGLASFSFGILGELRKPPKGEVITGKGVVICKYPSDPSVVYGYVSTGLLIVATFVGYSSLNYPYKGKRVPKSAIFGSKWCSSFLNVAWATSVLAAALLMWPAVQGHVHRAKNVHEDLEFDCPTAKTGLLGGGAFVSLNASLFWMLALMLAINAREDYLEEEDDDSRSDNKHEII